MADHDRCLEGEKKFVNRSREKETFTKHPVESVKRSLSNLEKRAGRNGDRACLHSAVQRLFSVEKGKIGQRGGGEGGAWFLRVVKKGDGKG